MLKRVIIANATVTDPLHIQIHDSQRNLLLGARNC